MFLLEQRGGKIEEVELDGKRVQLNLNMLIKSGGVHGQARKNLSDVDERF